MKKIIIISVLIVVAAIMGIFFFNKKSEKTEDIKHIQQTEEKDKDVKTGKSEDIKEVGYGNTKIDIKASNKKEDRPIKSKLKLKDWQKKFYKDLTEKDIQDMINEYQPTSKGWQAGLGWFSSNFPNESDGWSSTEETINGKINPKYTVLTDNNFRKMMAISLNRIVNPVFGGWEDSTLPIADENASENIVNIYDGLATTKYIKDILSDNPKNGKAIFDLGKNYAKKLDNSKTSKFGYIGNIKKFDITRDDNNFNVDLTVDYIMNNGNILETRKLKINYIFDEKLKQLLIDKVEDNNQYNFDVD